MRAFLPALLLSVFLFTGCTKKYSDYKKAIVVNSGNITPEGCGYILAVDGVGMMKPENMPSGFTHDQLPVLIKYHSTGATVCSASGSNMEIETIEIEDIVRQ